MIPCDCTVWLYGATLTPVSQTVDPYNLSGTVYGEDGTTPLVGVTVTVAGQSVTTGEDGTFSFEGLTQATVITAVLAGYGEFTSTTTYSTTTSDIVITLTKVVEDVTVNVAFDVSGGNPNGTITITKDGESSGTNITNSTSAEFKAQPGDTFTISELKASNVTSWEVKGGTKDDLAFHNAGSTSARHFTYTVPANAVSGTTYGVTFNVAEADVSATDTATGNNDPISFGEYGFGQDKINTCGNDAREHFNYAFMTPSLSDYRSGYSDDTMNAIGTGTPSVANQYGILNAGENTYVSFTTGEDVVNDAETGCKAYVDLTGAGLTVEGSDGTNQNAQKIEVNNKSRYAFDIKPNVTYTLNASSGTVYLKSIRIYNPNNVFKIIDINDLGTGTELLASHPELAAALGITTGTEYGDKNIVRIIGQVLFTGSDAENVEAAEAALGEIGSIGFDVYTEEQYNATEGDVSNGVWYYDDLGLNTVTAPKLYDTIVFSDMVNTAVSSIDNEEAMDYGTPNSSDSKDLYCQTFIATDTNLTLVPWCTKDGTKVYSIVEFKSADQVDKPVTDVIINAN